MNKNLKLVINNTNKKIEEKYFFEKEELKILIQQLQLTKIYLIGIYLNN